MSIIEMGEIKEITVQDYAQLRKIGAPHQLIDVREPNEFEFCNLDGLLIPLRDVNTRFHEIKKDLKIIVHCRSGKRSATAIQILQDQGLENLYNLKGGILAWADEIDSNIPKY
jgi:sulfur-carrier protein adenylyltransferase/sulfurtransferase|tara:strand:- start:4970 stop:5308 length:339 start_codon:yes stop_codon:yes gene_type:complete